MASAKKDLSKQRNKRFSGRERCAFQRSVSSEISEETPKSRRLLSRTEHEAAAFEISYMADLLSISSRTSVASLVGPVLAT
jgi:hypothetical protein